MNYIHVIFKIIWSEIYFGFIKIIWFLKLISIFKVRSYLQLLVWTNYIKYFVLLRILRNMLNFQNTTLMKTFVVKIVILFVNIYVVRMKLGLFSPGFICFFCYIKSVIFQTPNWICDSEITLYVQIPQKGVC